MKEPRSAALTIAAGLCAMNGLASLVTLAEPTPPPVVYASVAVGPLGLAGAYGVWWIRRGGPF